MINPSLIKQPKNATLPSTTNHLPSTKSGFTIVELLVVIVVIGILAAITIVSYTGISQKAIIASLQSDLTNGSNQLKIYQVIDPSGNSGYPNSSDPDSVTNCPTPASGHICLKFSGSNSLYSYTASNVTNPKTFTLCSINGTTIYCITNDSAPVDATNTSITAIAAITGTTTVGSVLTAGALTPSGATATYQWQSATTSSGTYTNISSATASTYTLVMGDLGKYIKVVATATGNYTGTQTSAASSVVSTSITAIAAITGTTTVGSVLTAGALTPSGATATYQWQSATTSSGTYTNISSATASTYTLVMGDLGKYIKVVATATGNYTGTQTSAAFTGDPNWLTIGTQVWAKANLNVGIMVTGITAQTNNTPTPILEKYCYNDLESNCTLDNNGGLYQWDEAMQYVTTQGAQGICPAGSHIPTDSEWTTLETYLGSATAGTQLKSGGTSGLNMPLAGNRSTNGLFYSLSSTANLWSSSESSTSAWSRNLRSDSATVGRYANGKGLGFSVRCLGN